MRRAVPLVTALVVAHLLATPTHSASPPCLKTHNPAPRTLAYVLTECRQNGGGFSVRQRLLVQRGDCTPVAVMDDALPTPVPEPIGLCRLYGEVRSGQSAILIGAFQWLALAPDGSGVVFEVTDRFSLFPQLSPVLAEEGIFYVRADGTGLRKLAPPSRVPIFVVNRSVSSPIGVAPSFDEPPRISPDGRTVAFVDLGPGDGGQEAQQVFAIDIRGGSRRQLTSFASLGSTTGFNTLCCAEFAGNHTVTFLRGDTLSAFDVWRAQTTGGRVRKISTIEPGIGGVIVPQFAVLTGRGSVLVVRLPGEEPVNPTGTGGELDQVTEVSFVQGRNVLQLTNFGRVDTAWPLVVGKRVVFSASDNSKLGNNPDEIPQLFSIDMLGGDLRQLTNSRDPSRRCRATAPIFDPASRTIVFRLNCDPFGTNASGDQVFAIRPDGTGLRQLTTASGYTTEPDGTVHVELVSDYGIPTGRQK